MTTSYLPAFDAHSTYLAVGNTWGLDTHKEIAFIGHQLGIKSIVMLIWLGFVLGAIKMCLGKDKSGHIFALLMVGVISAALLIRTYSSAPVSSHVGEGFIMMLVVIILQVIITIRLWYLKSQIDAIEALENDPD